MEITLEKIELVKDRTGVSYREAKEALEAVDGNVVDAIIKIEDEINANVGAKITDNGAKIIEKIKFYIRKGNVSRISIKKDNEILLNIPVTVGVVGTALAPWLTVIGSVVALGMKCEILLVKEDGSHIDLSVKVTETFDEMKEKGSEAIGTVREKVSDAAGAVKDRTDKVKSDLDDIKDIVVDAAQGIKETVVSKKDEEAGDDDDNNDDEGEDDENKEK
jgi:hypothetical protein